MPMLAVTLVLLLGVLFRGQSVSARCPPGYKCNKMFGECWKKVEKPTYFGHARTLCLRDGGDLISLHPNEMMDEAKETLWLTSPYYFVGAWFYPWKAWYWLDGTKVDKTAWSYGPPPGIGEYCGALESKRYLTDYRCGYPLPFICQAGFCSDYRGKQ